MHEVFALKKLIEEAKKYGKVKRISLEVGELAPFEGDHLLKHLKELVDWKVDLSVKKAKVRCNDCGYEGEPKIVEREHDNVIYVCPKCGKRPNVLEGDELILVDVEVE